MPIDCSIAILEDIMIMFGHIERTMDVDRKCFFFFFMHTSAIASEVYFFWTLMIRQRFGVSLVDQCIYSLLRWG